MNKIIETGRGGRRIGSGRPLGAKNGVRKPVVQRREVDKFVARLEDEAAVEVRAHAARQFLREQIAKDRGEGADHAGQPPPHMLDKSGKVRKFASARQCGLALLNDPTVPADTKAKLVIGLLPYEMPRLAEKPVGKKEQANKDAQTAGNGDSEWDGLLDAPKRPRLAVNNAA